VNAAPRGVSTAPLEARAHGSARAEDTVAAARTRETPARAVAMASSSDAATTAATAAVAKLGARVQRQELLGVFWG
jgi:hypothetical protein